MNGAGEEIRSIAEDDEDLGHLCIDKDVDPEICTNFKDIISRWVRKTIFSFIRDFEDIEIEEGDEGQPRAVDIGTLERREIAEDPSLPNPKFQDRKIERTFHPSQRISPNLKKEILEVLSSRKKDIIDRKIDKGKKYKKTSNLRLEEVSRNITEKLIRDLGKYEIKLSDSYISSNQDLDEHDLFLIQQELEDIPDYSHIERERKKFSKTDYEDKKKEIREARESTIERILNSFSVQDKREFDEVFETIIDARNFILNGVSEAYSIWIDFDGAKRPEGIMFSIYGNLIWEDIKYGSYKNDPSNATGKSIILDSGEWEGATKIFNRFRKIDSFIYFLTKHLKRNSVKNRDELERIMDILKEYRKSIIEKLIMVRNLVENYRKKSQLKKDGKEDKMIFLSKRIRFLPRLDKKHIVALREYQENKKNWSRELISDEIYSNFLTLQHIETQILDINDLYQVSEYYSFGNEEGMKDDDRSSKRSSGSHPIPQIMIANADGEDVLTLHEEVESIRNRDTRKNVEKKKYADAKDDISGVNLENLMSKRKIFKKVPIISIVPLFESKHTTSPEYILIFLENTWGHFSSLGKSSKEFEDHINEIFFAGSDLSKDIGQFSALVRVWAASAAIEHFNRKYTKDVRVKLGTGETLFRQFGIIDTDGNKSIFRGKITGKYFKESIDSEPDEIKVEPGLDSQEEKYVQKRREYYKSQFGENWEKEFRKIPSGYNFILKKFPFINSFTFQSSTAEDAEFMNPSRLISIMRDLDKIHEKNFSPEERKHNFKYPPEWIVELANKESQIYQEILGDVSKETHKPNGLMSLPAIFEFFSKKGAVLRQRGLKRESEKSSTEHELIDSLASGIKARAISTNSVSHLQFPLALIGKGSMIAEARKMEKRSKEKKEDVVAKKAQEEGSLDKLLDILPIEEILKTMKLFGENANDIFDLMRRNGLEDLTEKLESEWNNLLSAKKEMRAKLLEQLIGKKIAKPILEKKESFRFFIADLKPKYRELFDDGFKSKKTIVYRNNFVKYGKPLLEKALDYLSAGNDLITLLREIIDSIKNEIRKNNTNAKNPIPEEKFIETAHFIVDELLKDSSGISDSADHSECKERFHELVREKIENILSDEFNVDINVIKKTHIDRFFELRSKLQEKAKLLDKCGENEDKSFSEFLNIFQKATSFMNRVG